MYYVPELLQKLRKRTDLLEKRPKTFHSNKLDLQVLLGSDTAKQIMTHDVLPSIFTYGLAKSSLSDDSKPRLMVVRHLALPTTQMLAANSLAYMVRILSAIELSVLLHNALVCGKLRF